MPLLTEDQRAEIAARFQSDQSSERASIAASKVEVREVVDAIDATYDAMRAQFEAVMPPGFALLTKAQQRSLLLAVISEREGLDG